MILPLKLVKFQNVFSTQSRPPGNQTKSLSLKFSLQLFTWLVSWVGFLGDGSKLKIYSEIFLPLHMQRKEIGCNEKGSRPIQFLLIDVLSHEHWPVCCKCSTKSYNYLINTPNKITFQISRARILPRALLISPDPIICGGSNEAYVYPLMVSNVCGQKVSQMQ